MSELPIKFRKKTIDELASTILQEKIEKGSIIELVITIEAKGLNVREFAGYLSTIDGFYGRLYPKGFYSYVHKIDQQLQISEVRKGSTDFIITQVAQTIESQRDIIVFYLSLKLLPTITKAYKNYEEARLARINRIRIAREMKRDESLQQLTPEHIRKLAMLLEKIYSVEIRHLTAAIRFAQKYIKEVTIKVKKVDKKTNE
jgi:hypothetical protein